MTKARLLPSLVALLMLMQAGCGLDLMARTHTGLVGTWRLQSAGGSALPAQWARTPSCSMGLSR